MYTRFLESLFEAQTFTNEGEQDPLGSDVSVHRTTSIDFYKIVKRRSVRIQNCNFFGRQNIISIYKQKRQLVFFLPLLHQWPE